MRRNFDISFATQYQLFVFDQDGNIVDRVGSAREEAESFCTRGTALPGNFNGLKGESWRRCSRSARLTPR
ncbi:hypothetical protein [Corynebacterium jeddahense]|nr:hypothetical protein [Corynebacterium jeddahense]